MSTRVGLQLLTDDEGSVTFGWIAENVLYARHDGGFSAKLGANYASQLQSLVRPVPLLESFIDASGLTHYDLLARSAFVRMVQANRRKFSDITVLTWREGISSAAGKFAEALGGGVQLTTEKAEFMKRLMRSAPRAHQVLAASDAQTKTSW